MVPFLLSPSLPCCPSLFTSPEVKSHLLIHACHTSNTPLLLPLPSPLVQPNLPSLCLGSTFIFFRRLSIPLRSVMPYSKAIFSYSLGWALLSNSHTSISGSCFSGFFFLSVKEKGYMCHWDWKQPYRVLYHFSLSFSLLSGFEQSTEIQISLILSSIPECMETDIQCNQDQAYLLTWHKIKLTILPQLC